ncbi:unnamed protein product [Effrenium voratum]|uniref:Uncharacterized protein n=1 Tax=Effrenium voratum TaxID=2562239 RepID=A0AA36MIR4_9DINO|nr:unnamed protein product [Effrenium voratum]
MAIPEQAALTGAVVALYEGQAEPRSKLIQWKVQRLFGLTFTVAHVRQVARQTPGLELEPPDAKRNKFCVLLADEPAGFPGFQDIQTLDLSQEEMDSLSELLLSGGWPLAAAADHQAFEIASWLCASRPYFFGQMLAFVRIAHSKSLLGLKNGRLVAYMDSEDYVRKCNLERRLPTGVQIGERYVASDCVLRDCLRMLAMDAGGLLWVCDIKRLFRERFWAELSETAFGCASLSELLQLPSLQSDFFFEQAESTGSGYIGLQRGLQKKRGNLRTLQAGMQTFAGVEGEPLSITTQRTILEVAPSVGVTTPAKVAPAGKQNQIEKNQFGAGRGVSTSITITQNAGTISSDKSPAGLLKGKENENAQSVPGTSRGVPDRPTKVLAAPSSSAETAGTISSDKSPAGFLKGKENENAQSVPVTSRGVPDRPTKVLAAPSSSAKTAGTISSDKSPAGFLKGKENENAQSVPGTSRGVPDRPTKVLAAPSSSAETAGTISSDKSPAGFFKGKENENAQSVPGTSRGVPAQRRKVLASIFKDASTNSNENSLQRRTCEDQKNESLAEDAWLHFQSAPSPLPPWCAVRRTFIECEAAEASPQLARPHSQPPCSLNFDSDAEVVYVDL